MYVHVQMASTGSKWHKQRQQLSVAGRKLKTVPVCTERCACVWIFLRCFMAPHIQLHAYTPYIIYTVFAFCLFAYALIFIWLLLSHLTCFILCCSCSCCRAVLLCMFIKQFYGETNLFPLNIAPSQRLQRGSYSLQRRVRVYVWWRQCSGSAVSYNKKYIVSNAPTIVAVRLYRFETDF